MVVGGHDTVCWGELKPCHGTGECRHWEKKSISFHSCTNFSTNLEITQSVVTIKSEPIKHGCHKSVTWLKEKYEIWPRINCGGKPAKIWNTGSLEARWALQVFWALVMIWVNTMLRTWHETWHHSIYFFCYTEASGILFPRSLNLFGGSGLRGQ